MHRHQFPQKILAPKYRTCRCRSAFLAGQGYWRTDIELPGYICKFYKQVLYLGASSLPKKRQMVSLFFCQDERPSVCIYECFLKHIQGFGHQDSTHTAYSSAEMPPSTVNGGVY
jgi:hypothetical protein